MESAPLINTAKTTRNGLVPTTFLSRPIGMPPSTPYLVETDLGTVWERETDRTVPQKFAEIASGSPIKFTPESVQPPRHLRT